MENEAQMAKILRKSEESHKAQLQYWVFSLAKCRYYIIACKMLKMEFKFAYTK